MCIALLIQIEPVAHHAGGVSIAAEAPAAIMAGRIGNTGSKISIAQQEPQTSGISTGILTTH